MDTKIDEPTYNINIKNTHTARKWDDDKKQFRLLKIGEEVDVKIQNIQINGNDYFWLHGVIADIKKYSSLIIFDKQTTTFIPCNIALFCNIYLQWSIKTLDGQKLFAPVDNDDDYNYDYDEKKISKNKNGINIFIKGLDGDRYEFNVPYDTTIKKIKEHYQKNLELYLKENY